ncbi:pentapeptide repeat-containing protein [Salinarimonas sp. NSM]|uniref:pentapeptide repeat-containing protein n=1 Tax=Salinarimonas sp. NSM TaxID=3458003 RepID=UPI004035A0AE
MPIRRPITRPSRLAAARPRPAAGEAGAVALARIEEIARNARTAWFGLLAYLAFVGVTLLGVRDIDFYSLEASTTLPLVNVAIPTTLFFLTAPWLGAALHVYLHLYLLKLWDALAEARERVDGLPLGDRVFPWLVIDWALLRRKDKDRATTKRPMAWLANLVTVVLVWLAAPLMLTWAWWRSMPAREELLTLFIAVPLVFSIYAGRKSWRRARRRLKAGRMPPPPVSRGRTWSARCGFVVIGSLLASVSWLRTEGGFDWWANRAIDRWEATFGPIFEDGPGPHGFTIGAQEMQELWVADRVVTLDHLSWRDGDGRVLWTPLAPVDLVGADLAQRPLTWVSSDTGERRFRLAWCRDRELHLIICERIRRRNFTSSEGYKLAIAEKAAQLGRWCSSEGRNFSGSACDAYFRDLENALASEWSEGRLTLIADLPKPPLRNSDLRHVWMNSAFLAGVDLSGARLEGANLSGSTLEGAILSRTNLISANLSLTSAEGADFSYSRLDGASLSWARLSAAEFPSAEMVDVSLTGARLNEANLSLARLSGSDLLYADLGGANLSFAALDDAVMLFTRLDGASLHSVSGLTQEQLEMTLGNDATKLPDGLWIISCVAARDDENDLPEGTFWDAFCGMDEEPQIYYSDTPPERDL